MLENLCTVGPPWFVILSKSNLTQEWFRPSHLSLDFAEIGHLIEKFILDKSVVIGVVVLYRYVQKCYFFQRNGDQD